MTPLPDAITDYLGPNQYTILRTWVATDACGNTHSTSVRILVNDTTPPTLTSAPDRTVLASSAWDFDQPTVADNCGSVTVSILSTLTNATSQFPGQQAVLATRT